MVLHCFPTAVPKNRCLEASIANPSGSAHFNVSQKVTFNCSISGGTSPYTILWDFGDGYTSSQMNPFHQFSAPGLYEVKARVTDPTGYSELPKPFLSISSTPIIQNP
ncbi:MAG: PKD domain-containing protein [Bacteroidia bacterium]